MAVSQRCGGTAGKIVPVVGASPPTCGRERSSGAAVAGKAAEPVVEKIEAVLRIRTVRSRFPGVRRGMEGLRSSYWKTRGSLARVVRSVKCARGARKRRWGFTSLVFPPASYISGMMRVLMIAGTLALSSMICAAQTEIPASQNVGIEMANVLFRYSPSLGVTVVALRGGLVPTPGHAVPSFNDPASFVVGTDAAEIRVNAAQLTALMNTWLLRSPKAQLKDVRIQIAGDALRIRGTMKAGLHLPFEATADLSLAPDNRIRLTVHQVHAAKLPVKSLMDALGFSMENLISQKGLRGLSVDKNSFLIDPQTAFPPPQIRGRLSAVRIAGANLVLSFGHGEPRLDSNLSGNYIWMRGGRVEYGREEMLDTDLLMIDSTPADPFDFYLGQYWCQMVKGVIKAQPDKSLRIRVPDYAKLPRGSCR